MSTKKYKYLKCAIFPWFFFLWMRGWEVYNLYLRYSITQNVRRSTSTWATRNVQIICLYHQQNQFNRHYCFALCKNNIKKTKNVGTSECISLKKRETNARISAPQKIFIIIGNVQRWKRYGSNKRIRDSNLLPSSNIKK